MARQVAQQKHGRCDQHQIQHVEFSPLEAVREVTRDELSRGTKGQCDPSEYATGRGGLPHASGSGQMLGEHGEEEMIEKPAAGHRGEETDKKV